MTYKLVIGDGQSYPKLRCSTFRVQMHDNSNMEEGHYTEDALVFAKTLPKVELHAHLNGSVRDDTIRYSCLWTAE